VKSPLHCTVVVRLFLKTQTRRAPNALRAMKSILTNHRPSSFLSCGTPDASHTRAVPPRQPAGGAVTPPLLRCSCQRVTRSPAVENNPPSRRKSQHDDVYSIRDGSVSSRETVVDGRAPRGDGGAGGAARVGCVGEGREPRGEGGGSGGTRGGGGGCGSGAAGGGCGGARPGAPKRRTDSEARAGSGDAGGAGRRWRGRRGRRGVEVGPGTCLYLYVELLWARLCV
jgi:hypothetical protein